MKQLRGWFGEQKAKFWLWLYLNNKTYHKFHNIIIPSKSGTTQIDHLIISSYGIFIIETKNKKGWVFWC
ncbi:MAG: NERD domain-containing protein [Saprospiraceae bacterium]|nr:NERD domain-containing protein [Saprospiraceae bacterium]